MEPIFVAGPALPKGQFSLISFRAHSLSLHKPLINIASEMSPLMRTILPSECRRSGATYQGDLYGAVTITIDANTTIEVDARRIGRIPIMVASSACHLRGKSRAQLVAMGEEEYEVGGTFIVQGYEKVIRQVNIPRSNHAISSNRESNANRGPLFTQIALSYRSMRKDMTSFTLHFHLLRSGSVRVRVTIMRREYFIPIGILFRALLPSGMTDEEIYQLIVVEDNDNFSLCNSAIAIVKELSERSTFFRQREAEPQFSANVSRAAAAAYLGKIFKPILGLDYPQISDQTAGETFLRRHVLVHLSTGPYQERDSVLDKSKADLLVLIVRKLVASSTGEIEIDNQDAISHQALLTPGQLYLNLLKQKIEDNFRLAAFHIRREAEKPKSASRAEGNALKSLVLEAIARALKSDQITKQLGYTLSTGNLRQDNNLDLPQNVGYSIMAERINFLRFLAHFRAVHRGAFYAAMRSTKVRKLLPEAWGFICPVHTPDGEPCGILNHLSSSAIVTTGSVADSTEILDLFSDFNFTPAPALSSIHKAYPKGRLPVVVDGRVMGYVARESAEELADQIRYSKIRKVVKVLPDTSEVVLIMPSKTRSGFQPGIFVHTGGGRIMRPVHWLKVPKRKKSTGSQEDVKGMTEFIGTLEQVFLRVRPPVKEAEGALSAIGRMDASHAEVSSVAFLSVLASLSPFPDMNQGPRNMFQCQMAKQAMGTPCHTIWSRSESKVYRHTTPQVPITRNFCMQDHIGADLFPNGVNAVVAVVSYSGNDMEDALIINKASLDRGFAHGTVYINHRVDLDDSIAGRERKFVPLSADEVDEVGTVDADGLPAVGSRLKLDSMMYGSCGQHVAGGIQNAEWKRYKSVEDATVDEVTIMNSDVYKSRRGIRGEGIREANIRTRVSRKPCVGDKFASRAGQKGTMSSAWPSEDMPFSESGMTPDILFNPNGFPSRMTIGMMVEMMSGKAGALHGLFNDSSPFRFDENRTAIDFFAEQLVKAGYSYSGNETLYSGYTGEPFEVQVFTGIVHYQRLRHMVADKFQVRTTGSVHPLFRQPIKGRKKGGAIRFGEMERDGLLAHGASFLLRDRLAMASDMHILHVCSKCGSLLTPVCKSRGSRGTHIFCRECTKIDGVSTVEKIAMPYSFKYLANELAAMNIRTKLSLTEVP